MVKALDCQSKDLTGSSPTSYHRSYFLHLAPNPGPSKIVNWEPGLGWGRTRPLAVPNSTEVQVGLLCVCVCVCGAVVCVHVCVCMVHSVCVVWFGGVCMC